MRWLAPVILMFALPISNSVAHAASPEMTAVYQRIRAEATTLAGRPADISQRVVMLHEIYEESLGNHVFPQVALHGALWAYDFFAVSGPIGDAISHVPFHDTFKQIQLKIMLRDFAGRFKAINRQVFVDTYTNYYFTKAQGELAGAEDLVPAELLTLLNRMHAATRAGRHLDRSERAALFSKSLYWEQERSVGPMIADAVAHFDCPELREWVLRPIVHFSYFPATTWFFFHDFSNKQERIHYATRSYELAEQVGWARVVKSMAFYGALPVRYFHDPSGFAAELRHTLLSH